MFNLDLARTIALTVVLCLAGVTADAQQQDNSAGSPPNIVMVFIDDMGPMDLGAYGSTYHQTPNFDTLAEQGMRFDRAYASAAMCTPTRVSLFSGQNPVRHRTTSWIPGYASRYPNEKLLEPADWNNRGLLEEWTTLPEMLREAGYATAMFGKWHAGSPAINHGFDKVYQDWDWNRTESQEDPKGVFGLTDMATDFLSDNRDKPAFIVISHFAVHTPLRFNNQTRDAYRERQDPQGRQQHAGYAAMVEVLDDSLGRLMAYLDAQDLADNTILIVYADNGGLDSGPNGPANNDPLRRGKATPYEGGHRVPMIVRWPGVIEPGSTSDTPVITTDFFPTLTAIAGIEPDTLPDVIDGVDLTPVLSERGELEPRTLYWHHPHYHPEDGPASVIMQGDLKLVHRPETGRNELYDLAADPSETTDLAERMPEQAQALHAKLEAFLEAHDAPRTRPNPNFDPEKARNPSKLAPEDLR